MNILAHGFDNKLMSDPFTDHSNQQRTIASDRAKPSISLFFPMYNDGHAIVDLTEKAEHILSEIACQFEIVIINDGSTDNSGAVADRLATKHPFVRVIHHARNRGYGESLRTGFANLSDMEWICFTDGDHQYDIGEIRQFAKLLSGYDMLLGFRPRKTYGPVRRLISWGLNKLVRLAFGTPFRDVGCGFKMIRADLMKDIPLVSRNAFAGGEIAVRAAFKGYRIGEVAISMYPRQVGRSSIISLQSIATTLADVFHVAQDLFRNHPRK